MKRKDLVIIGAGGFGREVLWQLSEVNHFTEKYNIMGFVDDNSPPPDNSESQKINGLPVLGTAQWLVDYPEEICAVICVGNPRTRKAIYDKIKINPNITFPAIIAEDARFSETVKFGQGCLICLSNVLTVNVQIGDFAIINLDCTIGHDAVLGDFATLYPSVNVSGNVHIGSGAEIGTGANIIQGKSIGENAVIGAGSVVIKDIPANCTAVGAPARPVKFKEE